MVWYMGGRGGGAKDISFEHEMSLLLIEKMHLSTVIAYKESGLTEKKWKSWTFLGTSLLAHEV